MNFQAIKRIAIILLLSLSALPSVSAGKNWETARHEHVADARVVAKATEIEVRTKGSTIIVTTNHAAQIKVFTILGQLVSETTLPAGSSQLTLSTHGVFLIKIGEFTCKVAI